MSLVITKQYATLIKDLLFSQGKLNISIVGNVSSGKSLFEDIFCQFMKKDVECMSKMPGERTDLTRDVDDYQNNIAWLIKMMFSIASDALAIQDEIVRVSTQTLDSFL